MSQTSKEIRTAWDKANLTKYNVSFHNTNDRELIEYVDKRRREGEKTSEIFRDGIQALIEKG